MQSIGGPGKNRPATRSRNQSRHQRPSRRYRAARWANYCRQNQNVRAARELWGSREGASGGSASPRPGERSPDRRLRLRDSILRRFRCAAETKDIPRSEASAFETYNRRGKYAIKGARLVPYNPGMDGYSIGRLADAAGVPTSTIRYYERSGLVQPDFRTGSNYRGYNSGTLERLRFIRSAQATGLSLQDISALLELTFSTDSPCDEVLSLMQKRLGEIRERIKELRHVERSLIQVAAKMLQGRRPGHL